MILDVLVYRNKKMKCFTNPIYTQDKLENLELNIIRSLIAGGPSAKEKLKNLAMYHLGTFDDETGKYDLLAEPELLFDVDDIIASLPEER